MKLNSQQLTNYINRIKFSAEDKSKYKTQIENLKNKLDDYLSKHPLDIDIKKTKQAGSWAKGTILKPSSNTELDIDLAFYLKVGEVDEKDLHKINGVIVKLLKKIYSTKEDDDFDKSTKTANVVFISSGLSVDIVPVIDVPDLYPKRTDLEGYVLQPDSKVFEWYVTSIDKQLKFIRERKADNANFSGIVRILKKWKAYKKLPLSSFAIELIVAHLDITNGVLTNIEESLLRTWTFLSAKKIPNISFNAPSITNNEIDSAVCIADPTNSNNNVTKYMSEKDWAEIQKEADIALDTISYACEKTYEGETIGLWKEILGSEFNINPQS